MTTEAKLAASRREAMGTANCRRLRDQGMVPGNVYGHHQDPVPISVAADALDSLIHARSKIVDLELDGKSEKTIFREVQWDTFGIKIHHFDLVRIDADERVTVEVPIELRGTAPGIAAGGILDQHLRSLSMECRALEIPDSIIVRIGDLQIGQAIHVSDLQVPAGAEVHNSADTVVVQVSHPEAEVEAEAGAEGGPAEPELIGRKKEDEEAEAE